MRSANPGIRGRQSGYGGGQVVHNRRQVREPGQCSLVSERSLRYGQGMSPRAATMSPEDRRASVVAAAGPLVRQYGRDVTTKQIAEAAGVAEGTLFRVFDDKEAILRAVVIEAIRPEPTLQALDRIDGALPLEKFLAEVVSTVQKRIRDIFEISMAARFIPEHARQRHPDLDPVQQRLVDMLAGYRHELSLPPQQAAEVLRLLVFAASHPMINQGRPLQAEDIITVMLDGIRRHDRPTDARPEAAPTPATPAAPGRAARTKAAPSAKRRLITVADPSP